MANPTGKRIAPTIGGRPCEFHDEGEGRGEAQKSAGQNSADHHAPDRHIINGQLMAVLVDDNVSDVNNQPGLVGIEIESSPCKVSVRNIWVKKFN